MLTLSLHAAVRVEAHDRKRLEQLRRYITRPALSDERVQINAAGQVKLKLKTPWRDGTTQLVMSRLEFMPRLAALVPRLHLIRFHGVLAPNAKLRPLVVPQGPPAQAQAATEATAAAQREVETAQARPHRISWARLLKRVFDIDMQHCPNCGGGELNIIAAILERSVIEKPEPRRRRHHTSTRAALPSRSRGGAARLGGPMPQGSGSIACRISATRARRHPILALQDAAARSSGLTWALLRAVKTPIASNSR